MFAKLIRNITLWYRLILAIIKCGSNQKFYDQISDIYDQIFVEHEQHATNMVELLNQLSKHQGSVLDLGCGTGLLTHKIALAGYPVVGLDLSFHSLALLKKRYPDIPLINTNAEHLPFQQHYFRSVVSLGAWRHFPNSHQLMAGIANVLSEDGILIIGYFPPSFAGLFHQHSNAVTRLAVTIYEHILIKLGYIDQVSQNFESETCLLAQHYFHSVEIVQSGKHWHLIVAQQPNYPHSTE